MRVERLETRLIVVRTVAQALLEHRLQFAEAAVAERLCETHQGRRLYGGSLGYAADGSERNIVRKLDRVGCDLRKPLR